MYRRDISSTLQVLTLLLGAFIVYHIWTQPPATLSPTPVSLPSTNIDTTLNFPPALVEPVPTFDIPRTRQIELGDAPSVSYQKIRDDLDRGKYAETESALRALGSKQLVTARDKAYVAALWNNLGVQQEKLGGIDVSVNAFKRAVGLAPHNPTALLNLTQAYWGLRHQALTPQFLERVIQAAPDDPFPHLALAELLIDKGRKADAAQPLKRARTKIQHDSNLSALLEKLEKRAAQTTTAPQPAKALAQKSKPVKPAPLPEQSSPQTQAPIPAPAEPEAPANSASDGTPSIPAPAEIIP